MIKGISIILLPFISAIPAFSQPAEKWIGEGNTHYKAGRFDKAAASYTKALESDPGNETARFNLASATYKLGQPDDAATLFSGIAGKAKESSLLAKAWYNKGVVLGSQKKWEACIEAYKQALRLNPGDKEARENLQKALLELKKKSPPKKQPEKEKKQQQQQPKKQPSRMSPKEAEQRLDLLRQKEKEVLQRMQKEKSKTGGGKAKDW